MDRKNEAPSRGWFSASTLFGAAVGASSDVFGDEGVNPREKREVTIRWGDLAEFSRIESQLKSATALTDEYRAEFKDNAAAYAMVSQMHDLCDSGLIVIQSVHEILEKEFNKEAQIYFLEEHGRDYDPATSSNQQKQEILDSLQDTPLPSDVAQAIDKSLTDTRSILETAGSITLELIAVLQKSSAPSTE